MKKGSGSKSSKDKEIWRPHNVKQFRDRYEISNQGRVRGRKTKKILKPGDRSGYKSCSYTSKNGEKKSIKIHRSVAMLFVPNDNPTVKTDVNHINGNHKDNRACNLEWCSRSANNQHAADTGLIPKTEKAIYCYNDATQETTRYPSILKASKDLGIGDATICNALKNTAGSYQEYTFSYVEKDPNKTTDVDLSEYKQIVGFPNYLINIEGKVYSLQYHKFMKTQTNEDGCQAVQLSNTGEKPRDFLIHQLVAPHFLEKKNSKHNSVHHIDGNKSNNNLSNLKWCLVPGIDKPELHFDAPYYDPATAIKKPKRKLKSAGPKDLLTAIAKNLSKGQRKERHRLLLKADPNKLTPKLKDEQARLKARQKPKSKPLQLEDSDDPDDPPVTKTKSKSKSVQLEDSEEPNNPKHRSKPKPKPKLIQSRYS